jgi:hypothetical protein
VERRREPEEHLITAASRRVPLSPRISQAPAGFDHRLIMVTSLNR